MSRQQTGDLEVTCVKKLKNTKPKRLNRMKKADDSNPSMSSTFKVCQV